MPGTVRLVIVLLLAALSPVVRAQDAHTEFERRRVKVLAEAGQRHLELGSWARDRGLVAQATAQFLRASEVSAGTNQGAERVLALMRQMDDRFWRKQTRRPPTRHTRSFEKRASVLEAKNRADWFGLAESAYRQGLTGLSRIYYAKVLESIDEPIEVAESGTIDLARIGTVPTDVVSVLLDISPSSLSGEGVGNARSGPISLVGLRRDFKAVYEVRTDHLVVQTDVGQADADSVHELLSAFLPILEEATGQRPTRALRVFVFSKRSVFNAWLNARGFRATKADGVCDYGTFVAGVCAEGHAPHEIQAIAIHETAHLYDFALSPVVFPSWYVEAWAESFGAVGTFSWNPDDKQLTVGRPLPEARLATLRADGALFPLRELLRTDGMRLLQTDPEAAHRFYAQSLAFLRFLRKHTGDDISKRLALWEAHCRGGALGAKPGVYVHRNQAATQALFLEMFGDDLDALELGFIEWMRESR